MKQTKAINRGWYQGMELGSWHPPGLSQVVDGKKTPTAWHYTCFVRCHAYRHNAATNPAIFKERQLPYNGDSVAAQDVQGTP
jgi:hypothetical protein